ncbi:phosphoribosylglycinamide formyltransferase [Kangiella sp. HZ709]|uniref:phosphoribosylglycinamide formyltransferase n=1 Tax=Kangiella sp. HZ709 TaxID=2666328 RepID=UPI0012AF31BB|nr:phosphoribosylglycinamide formyltransferase [Kangiella sp. HZ709]MRX27129.1 phosphoribosylglycinamide formyltransferase [Kangiella sp. HZ709]
MISVSEKSIVVLISGNGSNLQALIDAQSQRLFNGKIKAVISNKPNVYGLERAEMANIDAVCVDHTEFNDKAGFEAELVKTIDAYQPDLVILAGFMRILSSDLVQHYLGKIINIHPSLLPKYKGLHTHRQVLENGDKEHGTSVHFVTAELDGGPIIAQRRVKVDENDTEQTLVEKIQQQEHQLYPEVVAWFCAEKLTFKLSEDSAAARAVFDGKVL